jgi:GPH family glycoside/pentoside/hexuronide:cation symporter
MQPERIPLSKIIAYAFGVFGWSISINIISVMLLYLYLPPSNAGMVNLVPQIVFFGVINIIALVTASGRLFDAVVDPMIAGWSDRSKNPKGRRMPMMALAVVPMALFAIAMFFPPFHSENKFNLIWLAVVQLGYYFFFGMYVIPYNALLAELGHYEGGKMQLSTAQSVGFIIGIVVSSSAPAIANLFKFLLPAISILRSNQFAIVALNTLGAICMFAPVLFIEERKYVREGLATESLIESLKTALRNPNFRIFALADAAFFTSIAIITNGLLYYVKAILLLPESIGVLMTALMVAVTMALYPAVNMLERKISKRKMIVATFFAMVFVFNSIYWLGRYPISPILQVVLLMICFGIPYSFLSILPSAVLGEIAETDAQQTRQNKEGMYFGMRALFQKLGQTLGIMIFAVLTLYGKDPGHDQGLRLSGIVGGMLCLFAGLIYTRYKEA